MTEDAPKIHCKVEDVNENRFCKTCYQNYLKTGIIGNEKKESAKNKDFRTMEYSGHRYSKSYKKLEVHFKCPFCKNSQVVKHQYSSRMKRLPLASIKELIIEGIAEIEMKIKEQEKKGDDDMFAYASKRYYEGELQAYKHFHDLLMPRDKRLFQDTNELCRTDEETIPETEVSRTNLKIDPTKTSMEGK